MPTSPPANAAEAIQRQQQKDAERLGERLEQIAPADLRISYTLGKSSVVLPGLLVRLITLAVLFRLNSAKKWRLALEEERLPEPVRRWLDVPELSEQERAKLEAARVAEPCERLQALEEAFEEGQFDFVTNLLACSYSRCGCFCR